MVNTMTRVPKSMTTSWRRVQHAKCKVQNKAERLCLKKSLGFAFCPATLCSWKRGHRPPTHWYDGILHFAFFLDLDRNHFFRYKNTDNFPDDEKYEYQLS